LQENVFEELQILEESKYHREEHRMFQQSVVCASK